MLLQILRAEDEGSLRGNVVRAIDDGVARADQLQNLEFGRGAARRELEPLRERPRLRQLRRYKRSGGGRDVYFGSGELPSGVAHHSEALSLNKSSAARAMASFCGYANDVNTA